MRKTSICHHQRRTPPGEGGISLGAHFHIQIAHVRLVMPKGMYVLSGGQREPPELNWAGEPIREGEGYGGRPENIPEGCPPVLGEQVRIRPGNRRGRDPVGMSPEQRAKRQSEMMKQRWARN